MASGKIRKARRRGKKIYGTYSSVEGKPQWVSLTSNMVPPGDVLTAAAIRAAVMRLKEGRIPF